MILRGTNGQISIKRVPISVSEYIDYQVQSTPIGTVRGSLGQELATNALIQKSFKTGDMSLLKELGFHPPTNEKGEEVKQVGLSPGILTLLGVELKEYQELLRAVVGVSGQVSYNDLTDEEVAAGSGLNQSDDFTFERDDLKLRVKRETIPWTLAMKVQGQLQNDPKRAYVQLFERFTCNDEPITYEMLKDPNGLDIEAGILIFLKLANYLKGSD